MTIFELLESDGITGIIHNLILHSTHWYDLLGHAGMLLIVTSYFLTQLGKLKFDDIRYSLINGTGGVFLLVSLCFNFNGPSFMIEIFWIAISLIGIFKWVKSKLAAPAKGAVQAG